MNKDRVEILRYDCQHTGKRHNLTMTYRKKYILGNNKAIAEVSSAICQDYDLCEHSDNCDVEIKCFFDKPW